MVTKIWVAKNRNFKQNLMMESFIFSFGSVFVHLIGLIASVEPQDSTGHVELEVLGNNFRGSLEILEFSSLTDEIWSRMNVRGWF